jgi:hypothetical protein
VQAHEPDLWAELDAPRPRPDNELSSHNDLTSDEENPFCDDDPTEDDSSVPLDAVLLDVHGKATGPSFAKTPDGKLTCISGVEELDGDLLRGEGSSDEDNSDSEYAFEESPDEELIQDAKTKGKRRSKLRERVETKRSRPSQACRKRKHSDLGTEDDGVDSPNQEYKRAKRTEDVNYAELPKGRGLRKKMPNQLYANAFWARS